MNKKTDNSSATLERLFNVEPSLLSVFMLVIEQFGTASADVLLRMDALRRHV